MPKTHCSEQIKCHDRDSIESPPDYEAVPTVHRHEAHNFACDERIEVPREEHRKVGNRDRNRFLDDMPCAKTPRWQAIPEVKYCRLDRGQNPGAVFNQRYVRFP